MVAYRNIFLVDGLGSMTSALFLWLLSGRLHAYVGMPVPVLKALAIAAACFCVYSVTCLFVAGRHWKPYLWAIAMINLLYCLTTFACLVRYWHLMKLPGIIYFLMEILVILVLVSIEIRLARRSNTREHTNRKIT